MSRLPVLFGWLGVVEKIWFTKDKVDRVEIFRWGKTVYQAVFRDVRQIGSHQIPFRVTISNAGGQGFAFVVDRYWADIKIPPAAFQMTPAE